jgi:hypothetical protein
MKFANNLFGLTKKRKRIQKKTVPRPSSLLRKKAKKLGVRIKTKLGYKKETIIKKQIKRVERSRLKKKMLLKKRSVAKKRSSTNKKTVKRTAPKRRQRFGKMTGHGWSATTAPMMGFVKPYNMSMAEQITGMTDKNYLKHISSRTATPVNGPPVNVAQANNYYGTYGLGTRVNPVSSYGKVKRGCGCSGRSSVKKSRVVKRTRRKNNFGSFFF